ncbi:MAG: DNA-binding protein [Bacteroidia bacterium]
MKVITLYDRKVSVLGDTQILDQQKTAFFCSRKFPASVVLKAYDWATEMRDQGRCVISGFHSPIEKDVLHFLLKGTQPIILVHARCLKKREEPEVLKAVSENRLLVLSPFNEDQKRITSRSAFIRNQFMVEMADEIVVGYGKQSDSIAKILNNRIHIKYLV